ncbi:MAG: SusC/RagA family TonB-linked outer membrane protein, partial [Muribaculaceae bacterium]|nr:SusC/RagA family TonB-linked outer membrane protein [Muribaculaceae bacterium]
MKQRIKIMAACAAMTLATTSAMAQTAANPLEIKGVVLDQDGIPVAGAIVRSANNGAEAITDTNGGYAITVADGSRTVNYHFVGYPTKTVNVADAALNGNISMGEPSGSLDEIIDLGYYKVTRRELTGAVSTVYGSTLQKSPESHLGKTFAGRLPGLTVIENNGEPGRVASSSSANGISLIIRGLTTANGNKPLIIIDGQISPNANYMYITPEEIDKVTVLKDASAMALYGIEGGNGAVVITTKHGKIGRNNISVYFDEALQQASKDAYSVSAGDYARLRNQAGYNDGLGLYSQFSQDQIDAFDKNGGYDWYGNLFNKTMWMTRAGLTISGGTDRLQYFTNVNYMHETSPFKTEKNNDWNYNPEPSIDRFNFRSNVDVKINNWLNAIMSISGSINRVKTAGETNGDIYTALFKLPPTMSGPLTTQVVNVAEDGTETIAHDGNQILTIDGVTSPVYGMLNRSGYIEQLKSDIFAQGGLIADLDPYVKGLSVKALVGYQTSANNRQNNKQNYQLYVEDKPGEFTRLGTTENSPLSYSKTRQMYYNINLSGFVNYKRSFGKHYVNAMGYIYYQDRQTESTSGAQVLPYKRESMGVTATYGFMNRYFVRGDLGYSGSEQFHPDHRWYTTPAVSATWIASEESFMQPLKPWLSLLKFRFSYGNNYNDQLGDERMLYADYVDFQGQQGMRGNPELSPEKIRKVNYGVDLGLFNNELSVSFDYYNQRCNNVLISSSTLVPSFQGVPLDYYPMVNSGRIKNHGFELAALYTKVINRDWTVFVGGSYSYNKNTMIDMMEVTRAGYAYPYAKKGQSIGQKWGYIIDYSNGNGFFNFQEEIDGCGIDYSAVGKPRPGDFRYVDLNNDGKIDAKDKAPIGYSNCPRGYYTINGGFAWKNFEVSFLLQGTTKRSVTLSGVGSYETPNQGVFSDIHMNAWTQEGWTAGHNAEYPALSISKSTSLVDNDYFIQDGSYLKLRNAEIAYTLPRGITRKLFAEKIRFALNGQNLFSIDHLRSNHIDPEIGEMSSFPTYRA